MFATLRISGYTYDYQTESAQIKVTQLLDLLDYKTPPEDYRFISSSGTNSALGTVVTRLLNSAGISSLSLTGLTDAIGLPAPDRTNRSYIGLAQEILGERLYWLYHAPDETVKVVKYDKTITKAFERGNTQLIEWNPLPQRDIVPNVYRVTGGGDVFQDDCSLASAVNGTEEIYGDAVTEIGYWYRGEFKPVRTTIGRKVVERIVTEVTVDEPSTIQIKKTGYKDLRLESETGQEYKYNLEKVYEVFDTRYYDSQGRLTKQEVRKDGIAYGQYPDTTYDLYPDALEWITSLETDTTEYSSDPSGLDSYDGYNSNRRFDTNVLRIKVQTKNQKKVYVRAVVLPTGTTTNYEIKNVAIEKIVETWIEKCPDAEESAFVYQRKFYSRDPVYNYARLVPAVIQTTELFLINSLSKEEDNATPPSWQTRPPLFPRSKAKLLAEVRRNYPGSDDDLIDKREREYSAKSITTNAQARVLASYLADIEVGKAFGVEFVLPLWGVTEYTTDPTPLQVAWIHDRALLLDSVSLVIANNEAELAWEGVSLKRLSPVVDAGTPAEIDIATEETNIRLPFNAILLTSTEPFNASEPPDFSLISVDGNGDVDTSGGYVQASANQNQFAQILVTNAGSVVVDSFGNVVTSALDVYDPEIWAQIGTVGGDVVTINGEVVTFG